MRFAGLNTLHVSGSRVRVTRIQESHPWHVRIEGHNKASQAKHFMRMRTWYARIIRDVRPSIYAC